MIKKAKCIFSGDIVGSRESARTVRCPCGFSASVEPRYNRRVAGEVLPGWTVRIPSHTSRT